MVDVGALVALLVPALPFLKRAGEHVTTQVGEALGHHALEHAHRIWDRLAGAVAVRPAAQEAVDDVAAAPHDREAHVALVHQLREILESNPALAHEVELLFGEARQAGAVVPRAPRVAVSASLSNSAIVTGDSSRGDRSRVVR